MATINKMQWISESVRVHIQTVSGCRWNTQEASVVCYLLLHNEEHLLNGRAPQHTMNKCTGESPLTSVSFIRSRSQTCRSVTKYKSCGLGPRKQPRESLLLSDSHLTNFNWITWPLFMVSHLSCGTLIRTSQPWLKKKHMQHYLKFAQCFEDEKDHVLWLTELQHRDVVYFCSGNFCHLVLFEELIYLKKNLLYIYKKYCI